MSKEKNNIEFDEYEQSAVMFYQMSKNFRKMAYDLSKKQKRAVPRVLEALIFEPLEEVTLHTKQEKELLDIVQKLFYHKLKLIEYAQKRKEGEINE